MSGTKSQPKPASEFLAHLTRKNVQELFLTRKELLAMVPVERLLRAHIAEYGLKPASVLEGGIIRVPVQGGRVQLRRIVGCKERGTHLELVTEGSSQAITKMDFASNTNPFTSDDMFEKTGRAELEALVTKMGAAGPPIKQAAKQAWRIKVGKIWAARFKEAVSSKGARGLYNHLHNPIKVAHMLLCLADAPMLLSRDAPLARPPPGQLPPEQKALHAAGKSVRLPPQPTQEGPGSKAAVPAAAAAVDTAPSAPAQLGSQPAATAAPAAASAQLGAAGQRPLLVPRDPRLRPPAAPAAAAATKLQGITQQQGEPAAASGPYSPTQPSRQHQQQDTGQAMSLRAAGQEAGPLVPGPYCYSPTSSPVHNPVCARPKRPTAAAGAPAAPDRAAVWGEGKEALGKEMAVVATGVKQEPSGAVAAVKEKPSSAAAAACSSRVSKWAQQLFRQCILARVAEHRAGAECVMRLSRLAADMRSRGSGWTAIRDERLNFKEVCRELLDKEALGVAAELRYSVQHNDWEVALPPASTSRLQQQQQQQGEGEWGQSTPAAAGPGPGSDADDEELSWDSQDDFGDVDPEEDLGLSCSPYAYYEYELEEELAEEEEEGVEVGGAKRERVETGLDGGAEPPSKQQKLCSYYQRGRCKFGAKCWDLHA